MFLSQWRQHPRILWVILVGALIGMDQLTKTYFANTIALGEAVVVTDWFNFVHTLNRGAAFSFLASSAHAFDSCTYQMQRMQGPLRER